MFATLSEKPSVKVNRFFLLAGLLIFVPCYSYLVSLLTKIGISTSDFNTVWLSFDVTAFTEFFRKLEQEKHLQTFVWIYQLNILSMVGFMFTFFSLSLMVARRVPENSWLARTAYLFPVLPIIVTVADIYPSLLLLGASEDMINIATWKVMTISGCYYMRALLLYVLLFWMLMVGTILGLRKWRSPVREI